MQNPMETLDQGCSLFKPLSLIAVAWEAAILYLVLIIHNIGIYVYIIIESVFPHSDFV